MVEDDRFEEVPQWTAASCLLTVAAIVLIGALLVLGVLWLVGAVGDLDLPGLQ